MAGSIRTVYIDQPLVAQTGLNSASNSTAFDVGESIEAVVMINVTAVSATSITFKLQGSPDDGTTWFDIDTSWAAISTVSTQVNKVTNYGKYVRIAWTVSGTPNATASVWFVGKT